MKNACIERDKNEVVACLEWRKRGQDNRLALKEVVVGSQRCGILPVSICEAKVGDDDTMSRRHLVVKQPRHKKRPAQCSCTTFISSPCCCHCPQTCDR